jgi:hypothetical protein
MCPPQAPSTQTSQQKSLQLLNMYVASDNVQAKETSQRWEPEDSRRGKDAKATRSFRFATDLEVFHVGRSKIGRIRDPAAAE